MHVSCLLNQFLDYLVFCFSVLDLFFLMVFIGNKWVSNEIVILSELVIVIL